MEKYRRVRQQVETPRNTKDSTADVSWQRKWSPHGLRVYEFNPWLPTLWWGSHQSVFLLTLSQNESSLRRARHWWPGPGQEPLLTSSRQDKKTGLSVPTVNHFASIWKKSTEMISALPMTQDYTEGLIHPFNFYSIQVIAKNNSFNSTLLPILKCTIRSLNFLVQQGNLPTTSAHKSTVSDSLLQLNQKLFHSQTTQADLIMGLTTVPSKNLQKSIVWPKMVW